MTSVYNGNLNALVVFKDVLTLEPGSEKSLLELRGSADWASAEQKAPADSPLRDAVL